MRFSEYMGRWLYGEQGYYASYKAIGKEGDFYTAVSTSRFFGGTIAKHLISLIEEGFLPADATVCEIGAHHGYFLADMVQFLYTLRPALLQTLNFAIVERFEALQEQQRSYFEESFGDAVRLRHYASLDEMHEENAFFVANEIFDAFPCELYYKGKTARVDAAHAVHFDIDDARVHETALKYGKERGEIAVGYEAFAASMARAAKRFEFISFDYGEMAARPDVSLRIYAKHQVFPFFDETIDRAALFGTSDLTYDVTFAHVKDAFEASGAEMVAFKAQMSALVNMGILELLEMLRANVDEALYKQELEKVKMLILPEFLGERFKMIRLRKSA